MGALLVLSVVVLAFLCGRLQVTVNRLAQRVEQVEVDVRGLDALTKFFDEKE